MDKIWQIGVVVRDLDKAVKAFMDLMSVKNPPLFNKVGRLFFSENSETIYRKDIESRASCITCCFQFENIELEFIQPFGDAPSEWKKFLDERGEGLHHLGFRVENIENIKRHFQLKGYEEIQSGSWGGGEYHYFDTSKEIGFAVELMKIY